MKDIMRKHLWPAALVAALAVVGMLAAFVVLTGPQRGTAEAQDSVCDRYTGPALQALISAGICQADGAGTPAASPSPTTGGSGPVRWRRAVAAGRAYQHAGAGCVFASDGRCAGGAD